MRGGLFVPSFTHDLKRARRVSKGLELSGAELDSYKILLFF